MPRVLCSVAVALAAAATLSNHGAGTRGVCAWSPPAGKRLPPPSRLFLAKKRPNSRDADDMSSWYDPVDDDATPDQVFFQEMERQRLINQVGASETPNLDDIGKPQPPSAPSPSVAATPSALRSSAAAGPRFATKAPPLGGGREWMGSVPNGDTPPPFRKRRVPTMEQIKIMEATLSEYEAFMVPDNWLNEELQEKMWKSIEINDERTRRTEGGFPEQGGDPENGSDEPTNGEESFRDDGKNEPWDDFADEKQKDVDYDRRNIMEVPFPAKGRCRSKSYL